MDEVDAFVLRAPLDFSLHAEVHTVDRSAMAESSWNHWCLSYTGNGDWSAYVNGVVSLVGRDPLRRGLPGGGELLVGQLEHKVGESMLEAAAFDFALALVLDFFEPLALTVALT